MELQGARSYQDGADEVLAFCSRWPDDATTTAWNATSVVLVTVQKADIPSFTLVPLTAEDSEAFSLEEVLDWADQHVRDSGWPKHEAVEWAQEELLPVLREEHAAAGRRGDRLWTAIGDLGESVGWFWVTQRQGLPRGSVFLYQITVRRRLRRRGYGRAMLRALEELLAKEGVKELHLNVLEANGPAMALYESSGYELAEQYEGKRQLYKRLARRP
ncbi:MAG: GNAT family N-acetyltransferase [Chloroflexota bacterium]|nr:GNAT family N-acetyltransferase [Chloroflexota bacterium]